MLNKNKLLVKLEDFIPKYFLNLNQERLLAIECYNWLIKNPLKLQLILSQKSKHIMLNYTKGIDCTNSLINLDLLSYNVLAIDGSQIYPDRHLGISCFLINIGFVQIDYRPSNSNIYLDSEPYLYQCSSENLSQDIVNCKRSEIEFKKGFSLSLDIVKNNKDNKNTIFLSDGTLLFCYLDNVDTSIKDYFLLRYIEILELYYKSKIPIFGFISFPKSKDLLNIIKSGLELKIIPNFLEENLNNNLNKLNNISDYDLMEYLLKPFFRSDIFLSNSKILSYYPDYLKVKFCYINIGKEIARVEFPAWLSEDIDYLDQLLKIIIDQCIKGDGYPVALSESHEQAVVKNYDREFFLQQLFSISQANNNNIKMSQKMIKKRFINI